MKNIRVQLTLLSALSALLLSIPFLVKGCGWVALFALVPLLCAERIASEAGERRFWIWHYGTFLLWNVLTTFWVCNATVGGGIFACAANALQMSLVFGLFRCVKKRFDGAVPYIFLAAAWIAWEKWYLTLSQISWPWLVLGNSFATNLPLVQWYEFTGALGGSLWVWVCNLAIFGNMLALSDGRWWRWNMKGRAAALCALVVAFAAPICVSLYIWNHYEESDAPVQVVIAQPNFDPYEKFEALSQSQQNAILLGLVAEAEPAGVGGAFGAAEGAGGADGIVVEDAKGAVVEDSKGAVGASDDGAAKVQGAGVEAVATEGPDDLVQGAGDAFGAAEGAKGAEGAEGAEGVTVATEGTYGLVQGAGGADGIVVEDAKGAVVEDAKGAGDEAQGAGGVLYVAPETFTGDIIINSLENSPTLQSFKEFLSTKAGSSMVFGASTKEYFNYSPTPLAYRIGEHRWVVHHNSALSLNSIAESGGVGKVEVANIYHKSKLVVGVEMTPYPQIFVPLDDLLGHVMGRNVGQKRTKALNCKVGDKSFKTGCAICYESVYGEHCREYVLDGAELMTVITNDAWWGDTPGYRQHLSYSSLRAIELRRDIARSANTGISAIINQRGEIVSETSWWQRETLCGTVNLNSKKTFFVIYGDIIGRVSVFVFALLFAAYLSSLLRKTKR